ncbi:hypothetical protein N9L26_02055 [Candidatus Pacebacteria bacterium]|nr:hypothetical protein [Candidatus Paceibacterota bacterium]
MSEKLPRRAGSQSESGPEGKLEKQEMIARAQAVYAELLPHHNKVVDAETNQRVKELQAELHGYLMDERLGYQDFVDNELPWDPYFEMVKQMPAAANDNRGPALAKAS